MVAKKGDATTAVIDPETDEQLRAEKERRYAADWAVIERIGERNRDLDPDEVLRDVTEVVEEVRQELYEREQRQRTANRRFLAGHPLPAAAWDIIRESKAEIVAEWNLLNPERPIE